MAIIPTQPRMILCEGPADKAFFNGLIQERRLPQFDVFCPTDAGGVGHGVTGFSQFLKALTIPLALNSASSILVVGDCDNDPQKSFSVIQKQIQRVSEYGYGVPEAPLVVADSRDLPKIVIMMIPWVDRLGCLESICLEALSARQAELIKCVERYTQCTMTNAWEIPKKHKMQLQCLISALSQENPGASLRVVLQKHNTVIPLHESCFDQVAKFLNDFDSLIAAN